MINNVKGDLKCDLRKKLCVFQSAIPQKLKRNFNVHVAVEAFFHSTLLFQIFHTLTLTAPPIQVVQYDLQYNENVITGIDDDSMMTL